MKEREAILRRALLAPAAFRGSGGLRLRPFSLWTLDAAEEMRLSYFLAGPRTVTPAEMRYQVAALAWAHCAEIPEEVIDAALASGAWEEEARAFRRRPEVTADFPDLVGYLGRVGLEVAAATVKVIEKPAEEKERAEEERNEPEDLVEPYGSTAILWTLTGGELVSEDQLRFLYRGLFLPRALMFYHCALASALKWTVPIGTEESSAEEVKKAQVTRAKVAAARERTRKRELF